MATIDLNADLGEGYGAWPAPADADLFPLISSASIACGFHAGDPGRMREAAALAARHSVVVGAHPGYPDLLGFGRRDLAASAREVADYVAYQVGAMMACARAAGTRVGYVKPHGALYNRAARDPEIAAAVAAGVQAADPALALLGLAGSALTACARATGLRAVPEAFLDRGYQRDGSLAPRGAAGALLEDPGAAADRAVRLVHEGTVDAVDGTALRVEAESLCVHGDGARAVLVLRAVRARLTAEGIAVAPFIR